MAASNQLLKVVRKTHLYFGIFIAPALFFFAFTGAMQTFSLHETVQGSSYKPPAWIAELAQLHKKQTLEQSAKRPRPDATKPCGAVSAAGTPGSVPNPDSHKHHGDATADLSPAPGAAQPSTAPAPPVTSRSARMNHLPMKIFFLIVSIGLFTSTLTGLYMAYRYERNRWLVNGLLLAGVVVPLVLLRL